MTLIGVLVIGGLGYSFLGSAPQLNNSEYHKNASTPEACLQCHVRNVDKAPIMPHRPWAPAPSATARRINPNTVLEMLQGWFSNRENVKTNFV